MFCSAHRAHLNSLCEDQNANKNIAKKTTYIKIDFNITYATVRTVKQHTYKERVYAQKMPV